MNDLAARARAYRIFCAALECDPALRAALLERECAGDAACRVEVDALLALALPDAASTAGLLPLPPCAVENLTGHRVGRFHLLERIGEGGMGVVYLAERTDGVQQSVAVKLVAARLARSSEARFEREAHLLARLEHPGIARLIDAGLEDGRPWIAMEYARGVQIDEYCRVQRLTAREIIGLLVQIAEAVAAAHRMLVVHSDIKPANVLVSADGVPKLIDFGISTALQESGVGHEATIDARRLFSPGFAAPEQIGGGAVSVATDVFGLGALAYCLLTGTTIFGDAKDPVGYLRALARGEVETPSRAAVAAGKTPLEVRALRGDIDAVLVKALARDPSGRYATAADLRADLERCLERRPVSARAPSALYRADRFVRRNAVTVSLAGLLACSVLIGSAFFGLQARRASLARDMAAQRGQFLESLFKSADPRSGRHVTSVAELLDAASAELDTQLKDEPRVAASMLGLIAETNNGLGRYPEGLAASDRQLAMLRAQQPSALELGEALVTRTELLREEGKWPSAEAAVEEAVALLQPQRATVQLSRALFLRAVVLAHSGHLADAEAGFHAAIDVEARGDESMQQQRMFAYHGLAVLLADLGRYPEALRYARDAVAAAHEVLPPDHPDVLSLETTYAGALVNVHEGAAALPLFRQIIAAETRVEGATHKDTLLARLLLADDLLDLKRDAEAEEIALDTAQKLDTLLGADNQYALSAWQDYGSAACNLHQEDKGLVVLNRVAAARRRLLPAGDRYIHAATLSLGECLYNARRYPEAEAALLAAAAGLEAARGATHRRTQEAYRALQALYRTTHRPDDAERWTQKLIL